MISTTSTLLDEVSVFSSIVDIVVLSVDRSILVVVVGESLVDVKSAESVSRVVDADELLLNEIVLEDSTEEDVVGFEIGFTVKSA